MMAQTLLLTVTDLQIFLLFYVVFFLQQNVNNLFYRMAKIYCHINQCNASVQYFAILHADRYCTISKKPIKLKMRLL